MAYDQQKEYTVVTNAALNALGDITGALFAPGYYPVVVRAISAVITGTVACAGAISFDKRITASSDTGRASGAVGVLNIPNAQAVGTVVYKDGVNVQLNPGQELVLACTDAAGANAKATCTIMYEPVYETPANNTAMTKTA